MKKIFEIQTISFRFLLGLLSLVATGIQAHQDTSSCPCLTLEEKVAISGGFYPSVEKSLTERLISGNFTQYGEGYGVGCANHGNVTDDLEWCYVDPTNCELRHSLSSIYRSLFYSYAACGNPDRFVASMELLRSEDLRIVWHENFRGYQGTICPDKKNSDTCYGTVVDLGQAIVSSRPELNITWEETDVPQWILDRAANYTPFVEKKENLNHGACVLATGMGVVDLCLGAFTKNLHRGLITPFLEMGVSSDDLIVRTGDEAVYIKTMITNVFAPFSPSLWLTTFAVLIFLSLLFFAQEYPWRKLKESSLDRTFGLAIYDALLGFFAQEHLTEDDPKTWGGRFTLLAIAVQILLTTASYTANLTNFLVRSGFATGITSIEDAIDKNAAVCVLRNRIVILDKTFGEGAINYAINPIDGLPGFDERPELLPAMDKGICSCAIKSLIEMNQYYGNGDHCDKQYVGTPVIELPWGIPVSHRFERPLTTLITDFRQSGNWTRLQNDARPESLCFEQEIDAENTSLYPRHLSGAYMLSGILAVIGICLSISSFIKKRRRKEMLPKDCAKTNNENRDDSDDSEDDSSADIKAAMSKMKEEIVLDLRREIGDLKQLVIVDRQVMTRPLGQLSSAS